MKRILLLCIILICSSCQKEKAWRCYGDFESFDEGFIWEGKEYHENKKPRFVFDYRRLRLTKEGETYHLEYRQRYYSPTPFGKDYCLWFEIAAPVEDVEKGERIYKDCALEWDFTNINACEIVDGWVIIKPGEEYNNKRYRVPEVYFEFSVKSPEGEYSTIEKGYIYERDHDYY